MNIDFHQYKKSITLKSVWKSVFFLGLIYFIYAIFIDLIKRIWIDEFLSHFPQTIFSTILVLAFFVYSILRIVQAIRYKLLPTLASAVGLILVYTFYFVIVRSNDRYTFYNVNLLFFSIKYSDIILIAAGVISLDFRSYRSPLKKTSAFSLIADEPNPEKNIDLIENESYVEKIANTINETANDTSYSIGVFSSWGNGKTDFLLRLTKVLEKNKSENLIVQFNPWKAASPESLVEDFFNLLSSELKPYNKSIAAKLKGYSKKILSTGKEIHYRIADALLDELIKDISLQERYDSINESIKQTGKRLIVFIDDLDRMTGAEVVQVLRVIRNSANFTNTFFVVAMDHEYIVDTLQKTELLSKEEQYLKKIFQLVITLPQIRKETFAPEILKNLIYDGMPEEDIQKIKKAVSFLRYNSLPAAVMAHYPVRPEGYIEKMLDNYRDVKRFCNSFKINFNILKKEVEVLDLFLLELIRIKSFDAYENIANKNFLSIRNEPSSRSYVFNKDAWKRFYENSGCSPYSIESLESTITFLVEKNSQKGQRQLSYPHNFYLYFCYQLFNLISLEEFQKAIKMPFNEMRERFNQWVRDNKGRDLDRILDNITDFDGKAELQSFIKAFLFDNTNPEFNLTSRAVDIIKSVNESITQYFDNQEEYQQFVREVLADDRLSGFSRATVANELLKKSIYNEDEPLILPKAELHDIVYRLFDSYLNVKKNYDHNVYAFYLLNDESRSSDRRVILFEKANKRLREFLSIPETFDGYLDYIIRSYQIPTDGSFVFAPFTIDIFGTWLEFKKRLKSHEPIDGEVKKLMPIILRATEGYIGGQDRFFLDGSEKVIVLDHLRKKQQYPF